MLLSGCTIPNKHSSLNYDFLDSIQNVMFVIFYKKSKATFSYFSPLSHTSFPAWMGGWIQYELSWHQQKSKVHVVWSDKWWDAVAGAGRDWQHKQWAPPSQAVPPTASAWHQGYRLNWAHPKASASTSSQPGWALTHQGCQIHTSPCLLGNSVTQTRMLSLGPEQCLFLRA